jgi:hypothetical protein
VPDRLDSQFLPDYDWQCGVCHEVNLAGTTRCSQCDTPAKKPAIERTASRHKDVIVHSPNVTPVDQSNWLFFFPEGIWAIAVVLASPFWFISLLNGGRYASATILALSVITGLALAGESIHRRTLLYAAMMSVLLGCGLTLWLSPQLIAPYPS